MFSLYLYLGHWLESMAREKEGEIAKSVLGGRGGGEPLRGISHRVEGTVWSYVRKMDGLSCQSLIMLFSP